MIWGFHQELVSNFIETGSELWPKIVKKVCANIGAVYFLQKESITTTSGKSDP